MGCCVLRSLYSGVAVGHKFPWIIFRKIMVNPRRFPKQAAPARPDSVWCSSHPLMISRFTNRLPELVAVYREKLVAMGHVFPADLAQQSRIVRLRALKSNTLEMKRRYARS